MGVLAKPGTGSMQGMRQWVKDHPGRFDEIVDPDASYVFFMESKLPGAVGSQKVILTTQRSMGRPIARPSPRCRRRSSSIPGRP